MLGGCFSCTSMNNTIFLLLHHHQWLLSLHQQQQQKNIGQDHPTTASSAPSLLLSSTTERLNESPFSQFTLTLPPHLSHSLTLGSRCSWPGQQQHTNIHSHSHSSSLSIPWNKRHPLYPHLLSVPVASPANLPSSVLDLHSPQPCLPFSLHNQLHQHLIKTATSPAHSSFFFLSQLTPSHSPSFPDHQQPAT
ncbi:hypothetical protein CDL15_Pgr019144 [Punica granatum]|uniref:Uncharacterized protein n=1 Tax=Punica granatum TaxID=22663 RepID=A0A218XL74_PUNGR|nr:hypothetical protein CDL15_Pgr019144 [Punica granatum]